MSQVDYIDHIGADLRVINAARLCSDCHTSIAGSHPNRRLCADCVIHRNREKIQRWYWKRRLNRPVPSIRRCRDCSVDISNRRNNCLYCEPCTKERYRSVQEAHARSRREKPEFKAYQRQWRSRPEWQARERERAKERRKTKAGQQADSVFNHKRRTRKKKQLGVVSIDIKKQLVTSQYGKCANCNQRLEAKQTELDHILPLSLGGMHDDSNLQVLCSTCNRRKSNKHPLDFAREEGHFYGG